MNPMQMLQGMKNQQQFLQQMMGDRQMMSNQIIKNWKHAALVVRVFTFTKENFSARRPKKYFVIFLYPPGVAFLGSRFHFHGFSKTCNKRAIICDTLQITQIHYILCGI